MTPAPTNARQVPVSAPVLGNSLGASIASVVTKFLRPAVACRLNCSQSRAGIARRTAGHDNCKEAERAAALNESRSSLANRLANETSPYLLQHKDNPVDWYPWGPEALAKARTEDKPILV